MIQEITRNDIGILLDFLKTTAPEQVQFVEGNYFKHGKNVSFGWFEKGTLVGCIRYCIQAIGYEQKTPPIKYNGKTLSEAKINAFAVNLQHQNKGIGKQLQSKVIEDAKSKGCSQVASYSTYDKVENYAVKVSLGFCIQPEVQPNGTKGCFFLMKL